MGRLVAAVERPAWRAVVGGWERERAVCLLFGAGIRRPGTGTPAERLRCPPSTPGSEDNAVGRLCSRPISETTAKENMKERLV